MPLALPRFALISMMALCAANCGDAATSSPTDGLSKLSNDRAPSAPINYEIEELATNLDLPWSLAFLPSGDMVFTERTGALKHLSANGEVTTLIDFNDLEQFPVHTSGRRQAGMFDVVLHPDFAENGALYIAYAAKQGEENTLVISRLIYSDAGDERSVSLPETVFVTSPMRTQSNHYGGRLLFLPDGTLLATTGEAYAEKDKAQLLDNHFGKTIRINDDGSVPADNPFVDQEGALPEIWTYGHRNPQGLILGADGKVYEHEHGPRGGDEINIIEPGINYGWPIATYGIDYSGAKISPHTEYEGTQQSVVHYVPSIGPSGFTQYSGDKFPDWQGDLFIGALAIPHVRHIEFNADGTLGEQSKLFTEMTTRIRDVRTGPDGYLYLLTEDLAEANGKILRVVPAQ